MMGVCVSVCVGVSKYLVCESCFIVCCLRHLGGHYLIQAFGLIHLSLFFFSYVLNPINIKTLLLLLKMLPLSVTIKVIVIIMLKIFDIITNHIIDYWYWKWYYCQKWWKLFVFHVIAHIIMLFILLLFVLVCYSSFYYSYSWLSILLNLCDFVDIENVTIIKMIKICYYFSKVFWYHNLSNQ